MSVLLGEGRNRQGFFLSFVFRAVISAEAGSNYNFYANSQDELILAISKSLPYLLSQLLTARHVNQTDRHKASSGLWNSSCRLFLWVPGCFPFCTSHDFNVNWVQFSLCLINVATFWQLHSPWAEPLYQSLPASSQSLREFPRSCIQHYLVKK